MGWQAASVRRRVCAGIGAGREGRSGREAGSVGGVGASREEGGAGRGAGSGEGAGDDSGAAGDEGGARGLAWALTDGVAGLGLEVIEVAGDGDCMFRALVESEAARGGGVPRGGRVEQDRRARALRGRAARLVGENWRQLSELLGAGDVPADTLAEVRAERDALEAACLGGAPGGGAEDARMAEYVRSMGDGRVWGGLPELHAAGCALGVRVEVLEPKTGPGGEMVLGWVAAGGADSEHTVRVFYNGVDHYWGLRDAVVGGSDPVEVEDEFGFADEYLAAAEGDEALLAELLAGLESDGE